MSIYTPPAAAGTSKTYESKVNDCMTSEEEFGSLPDVKEKILYSDFTNTLSKTYTRFLNKTLSSSENIEFSLVSFFEEINNAFDFLNQKENVSKKNGAIVLGNSGAGKSTLIGYLLNKKIVKKEKPIGSYNGTQFTETVLDYEDEISKESLPKIGHYNSETKGCWSYGLYLDGPGFHDTGGKVADICNSIALDIAIKQYQPNKVIFLLTDSDFTGRFHGLNKKIELLGRIIHDPTSDFIWKNILFLMNSKDYTPNKEKILRNIRGLICQLIENRNRSIPSKYEKIKKPYLWNQKSVVKELSLFQKESPDVALRAGKTQFKIEILYKILTEKNIYAADFSDSKMKEFIENWISERKDSLGIDYERFSTKNFVKQGYHEFIVCLSAAAVYYNVFSNTSKSLKRELADHHSLAHELSQRDLEKSVESINKLLASLRKNRTQLQNKIDQLKETTDEMEWPEMLFSSQPVTPRKRWQISKLAPKYTFTLPDITGVRPVRCQYDSKTKGKFSRDEESFLRKKKVTYKPEYHSKELDIFTKIRFWVKAKDHPAIHAKKEILRHSLKNIEQRIKTAKKIQKALKSSEKDLEKELVERSKTIQVEIDHISKKIQHQSHFFTLVGKIADQLELNPTEQEIFQPLM